MAREQTSRIRFNSARKDSARSLFARSIWSRNDGGLIGQILPSEVIVGRGFSKNDRSGPGAVTKSSSILSSTRWSFRAWTRFNVRLDRFASKGARKRSHSRSYYTLSATRASPAVQGRSWSIISSAISSIRAAAAGLRASALASKRVFFGCFLRDIRTCFGLNKD